MGTPESVPEQSDCEIETFVVTIGQTRQVASLGARRKCTATETAERVPRLSPRLVDAGSRAPRRTRTDSRRCRCDVISTLILVVPPRGFEPLISSLKGRCPRPLDDGGIVASRRSSRIRSQITDCQTVSVAVSSAKQAAPAVSTAPVGSRRIHSEATRIASRPSGIVHPTTMRIPE